MVKVRMYCSATDKLARRYRRQSRSRLAQNKSRSATHADFQGADLYVIVKARMYYSAADKLAWHPDEASTCVSAAFRLLREFTQDISKAKLKVKTGPPQNRHPASNGAGTHVLLVPPGFSLRFAKSCWPVFISPSRKARKHSGAPVGVNSKQACHLSEGLLDGGSVQGCMYYSAGDSLYAVSGSTAVQGLAKQALLHKICGLSKRMFGAFSN
jgi:hypothetical protein